MSPSTCFAKSSYKSLFLSDIKFTIAPIISVTTTKIAFCLKLVWNSTVMSVRKSVVLPKDHFLLKL